MARNKAKHRAQRVEKRLDQPRKVTAEPHAETRIFPGRKRVVKHESKPTIKVLHELAEALTRKRKPKLVNAERIVSVEARRQMKIVAEPRTVVPSFEFRLDALSDNGYLWRNEYQELLACSDVDTAVFKSGHAEIIEGDSGIDILRSMVFSNTMDESFAGQIGSGYLWKHENEALFAGYGGCNHKVSAIIDDNESFFMVH
ncbi:MAG: hypothetical protein Q8J63_10615 [Candidatus Aquicultor sp.]|nr:hypothetical protein [Candidatus Aquicultor sp.]